MRYSRSLAKLREFHNNINMLNRNTHPDIFGQHPATPSFRGTVALYIFSNLLFLVSGYLLQSFDLLTILIITELVFIAGPALLYTIWKNYDLSRTFSITPISFKTVLLVIITTCAAFVPVAVIAKLQELLFPPSENYQEIWKTILYEFHQVPFIFTFFLMAILPGVCEELLFRGFLLQGIRKKYSDTVAIVIVGFLFGAIHLDLYRFFMLSLLGMLFGYMVVKTGSIFTGIVAHSTNNGIIALLSYAILISQNGEVSLPPPPQSEELTGMLTFTAVISIIIIMGIALSILFLGLRALPKAKVVEPPQEPPEPPPLPPSLFLDEEEEVEDKDEQDPYFS